MLPASTPSNLSDITDRNTLVADDMSNLEQSLLQDRSLGELMPCSVQQPEDLKSVGPELDEGTIDNSSPVLGGLVADVQDGFDCGSGSFACGGENDSVSSLSSNQFSSSRGRNHFPALTGCKENSQLMC